MAEPHRPLKETQLSEEMRRVLAERDATFDNDRQKCVDAKKSVEAMRRKLKHPQPH